MRGLRLREIYESQMQKKCKMKWKFGFEGFRSFKNSGFWDFGLRAAEREFRLLSS